MGGGGLKKQQRGNKEAICCHFAASVLPTFDQTYRC